LSEDQVSPELMLGFGIFAEVRLSGPNSVNAFVGGSPYNV